ncbi:hypothetical protein DQP57_04270 [Mycobacterium colombiense]|uniref:Uncharacterized protein n=1 Tax=Mycobacterium colombiense TaxID=339268 RepID=A0A329M6A4_9MYCO|nr:hypothetical protein DQP57_04270 [Mycobacterium colombiense]
MPLSYLIRIRRATVLWWRPPALGYAALAIATLCRVTYWIAYCKVTRMSDAARREVDGASQIEESHQ